MRLTILKYSYIIVLFVFSFSFFMCSTKEKNEWEVVKEKNAIKFSKQKLILPHKDIERFNVKKSNGAKSNLKIVTFIDGSCSVCAKSLLFWEEFDKELKSKGLNCEIVIFLQAWDHKSFEQEYIKKLKITIPYNYDRMGKFIEINNIYDKRFQTFLINNENNILLFGDVVFNTKLKNLYLETIQSE